MAKRKAFLIRVDPNLLDALQRWADDDLRSLNSQIEYLLRSSLAKAGRKVKVGSDTVKRGKAAGALGGRDTREVSAASEEAETGDVVQVDADEILDQAPSKRHPGTDTNPRHPGT
jgi:hypothetical protein